MTDGLVLVTGSSGRIGRAVVEELQRRKRAVRGFDRVTTPGLDDMVVGTLTSEKDVARAMQGVHAVVHLAATPDDADFLAEIVPNNIIGVYHVMEQAQAAGVKRMVLSSSGQVTWYQRFRGPWPIGTEVQPTPRYWYAAGKVFLEAAGRAFAEKFGMSVIAVRLGWCPRTKEQVDEITASDWAQDVYLSPGDAGRSHRSDRSERRGQDDAAETVARRARSGHWRGQARRQRLDGVLRSGARAARSRAHGL